MEVLEALAEYGVLIDVPVYEHFNGKLGDRLNLEAPSKLLHFGAWALCPLWRYREGRIRAEYQVYVVNTGIRRALTALVRSVLELDDGALVGLARSRAGADKYPTYDFLQLTRTFRFWRDDWNVPVAQLDSAALS